MTPLLILGMVASLFLFTGWTGINALKEGKYAFLASMVSRLEEDLVAPTILRLLRENDLHALTHLLNEKGLISDSEPPSFGDLWESELKATEECRERYNRLLIYLPSDLREFFTSLRILRDVRNLEVIATYIAGGIPGEELPRLLEAGGIIEIPLLLDVAESRNLRGFIDKVSPLLPADFRPTLNGKMDFLTIVRKLNLAAVAFLRLKVKQIASPEVDQAFSHLSVVFDAKNVDMIARLKSEGVSAGEIKEWLIPQDGTIDSSTITQLAESEDYNEFLSLLLETHFGRIVLRDLEGTPGPRELWEASLRFIYSTQFLNWEESDEMKVWRYFFLLEHEERTIREGLRAIRPPTRGSAR